MESSSQADNLSKGSAQQFSNALMDAIDLCFNQQADRMDNNYWNALVFKEGVKEFKGISIEDEDASDAEALGCANAIAL